MTVKDELTEKKTLLVGFRFDSHSRELLNWALVKVAEPGDRVVAVHVCRASDHASKESTLLDGYLEAYKGLCNVKQINLTGQISRGWSVRKALVREAKHCDAMAVIVGISRPNSLGGWVSVAKHCARRLPPTTLVLAVHNGKVVFERGSSNQLPGLKGDPRPSFYTIGIPILKENKANFGDTEALENEKPSPEVVQNSEDGSRDDSGDSKDENFSLAQEYKEENPSNSISLLIRELPESRPGWPLLRRAALVTPEASGRTEARKLSVVQWAMSLPDLPSNSISLLMRELPESRPGWPLLRRAVSATPEASGGTEARKLSVVQWAMSLPNRSPPPTLQRQISLSSDTTENPFRRTIRDCESKSHKKCLSIWGELPKELELLLRTNSSGCKWFSLKELESVTSQFSSENLIGKGGNSHVYKGCLPHGKLVAVKILKSSREAWKDFALEVNIISLLKHRHIMPLIGVCVQDKNLISVYDFLPKGSLEENLHDKKDKSALSWKARFNVAVGIANALHYLHDECSPPVIHRDVKSSNILLSDEFEPQLSDFGLATWGPTTSSYVTHSDVVGTFGYLAPEYFMYGKVSNKIDVYSFGVVLLELLSGRRPICSETPKGQENLVMWARPILESGNLRGILDPTLDGKFDEVQMQRMVLAATLCTTRTARLRPKINQILMLLRGEKDVEEWVNSHIDDPNESDNQDDEAYQDSSADSPLELKLLEEEEDDTTSFSSVEQNKHLSLKDHFKRQLSRSSSFD
ncbi:hypothetical protein HHK36_010329 [Tetracentron sinense]|uniref:Protein kinase domain-containing protein n=1 Tax=Tetracentron sinense TaxID=13715 RepID=A0A835DIC7_TETSI|nr:hypothetical protein HHK36_010329 [Tetracentron sinense]